MRASENPYQDIEKKRKSKSNSCTGYNVWQHMLQCIKMRFFMFATECVAFCGTQSIIKSHNTGKKALARKAIQSRCGLGGAEADGTTGLPGASLEGAGWVASEGAGGWGDGAGGLPGAGCCAGGTTSLAGAGFAAAGLAGAWVTWVFAAVDEGVSGLAGGLAGAEAAGAGGCAGGTASAAGLAGSWVA